MDKAILEKLVSDGLSQREISDKLGKSQTSIRYWLIKYKLITHKIHQCRLCGQTKEENFTSGRYTECRKCRGRHQTKRFRSYKIKAVTYKGGKCSKCGYDKCIAALDFHHRDPQEKDPKWRFMRNWTFSKVKNELDKCDLVCRNCHAEIHYGTVV